MSDYNYDYLPQSFLITINDYRSINFPDYNYDYAYEKINYNRNKVILIIIDPNPGLHRFGNRTFRRKNMFPNKKRGIQKGGRVN
jgi:hypothetical protein